MSNELTRPERNSMSSAGTLAIVKYDDKKSNTVNEIVLKTGLSVVKDNGLALEFVSVQIPGLCMSIVQKMGWL